MISAARRDRVYDLLTPPVILATPFVSFVNYNDYSYAAPEIWISLAVLVAVGCICGAIVALGAWWLRIIVVAGLVTLFVDLQFDLLDEQPWLRVPVLGAGMLLLCWFLRDHLGRVATSAFGTMLAATLVFPGASGEASFEIGDLTAEAGVPPEQAPPVLVHLIFDEFIGVEGIPADGRGPEVKEELRSFLHANGLYVFGRAYSRFLYTSNAIPNALNYASAPDYGHFTIGRGPLRLAENRYFEDMRTKGYDVHVYQTDFMDFCTGYEAYVTSCRTFINTGIKPLETLSMPTVIKSEIALKTFVKLSVIQRASHYFYDLARMVGLSRGYRPPEWFLDTPSLAAARGLHALDIVSAEAAKARAGELFFVHILLPHQPYMYEVACDVRDVDDWDENIEDPPLPPNTGESRTRRYRLYLEQVSCTQMKLQEIFDRWRQAGIYDRMKVIVQGDHGSRIYLHKPTVANKDHLLPSDYTDSFSTLFAVKTPGLEPTYDTRMVAIQDLLEALVDGRPLNQVLAKDPQPYVLLGDGVDLIRTPLPGFGDFSREKHRLHLSQP
jgi:hypothetical protein